MQPLDSFGVADLLNVKHGLERNIPGRVVNGQILRPAASLKCAYKSAVTQEDETGQSPLERPNQKELD